MDSMAAAYAKCDRKTLYDKLLEIHKLIASDLFRLADSALDTRSHRKAVSQFTQDLVSCQASMGDRWNEIRAMILREATTDTLRRDSTEIIDKDSMLSVDTISDGDPEIRKLQGDDIIGEIETAYRVQGEWDAGVRNTEESKGDVMDLSFVAQVKSSQPNQMLSIGHDNDAMKSPHKRGHSRRKWRARTKTNNDAVQMSGSVPPKQSHSMLARKPDHDHIASEPVLRDAQLAAWGAQKCIEKYGSARSTQHRHHHRFRPKRVLHYTEEHNKELDRELEQEGNNHQPVTHIPMTINLKKAVLPQRPLPEFTKDLGDVIIKQEVIEPWEI